MNPRRLILLLLVLLAPAAPAAEMDDLYVGTVPVPDQSAGARQEALRGALEPVLVRITGDPAILRRQGVDALLEKAPEWVQRYGYEDGGGDDDSLRLRARFDATAVQNALRQAGLPVWGRERPQTLVLLVIEGEADIVSARDVETVASTMLDTAERRGVPLVFPRRGGDERRRLRAADIRYGEIADLATVAKRYDASHVLVGRVERVSGAWRGEWTLNHRGDTVTEWQISGAGRGGLLAEATERLSDHYARRFAVYGGAEADTVVTVAVDGVAGVETYARIGRYLRDLSVVETAIPVLVDREAVVFRVQLDGDAALLARSIALAGWLREDPLAENLAGLYAAGGHALGYRVDA